MDEALLFPSPNWFQVSGLAVSNDGWLVYSGPGKSLCIAEPLQEFNSVIASKTPYKVYFWNRAHNDKIVSVDLSPEWPEKRCILTGAVDGSVKQWLINGVQKDFKISSTHSHEVHSNEKEEVISVGYSNEEFAVTVGSSGSIVKWDLKSNVVKNYQHLLKNFKPTCMSTSPHILLQVAVGTKQGVVFVLDLNGQGKSVYKVRGQDDEILNVSWCPQYAVVFNKKKEQDATKKSFLSKRLDKIRNEPEPEEVETQTPEKNDNLEASGAAKNLPDDTFDESVVAEDDMFDIYKDHEPDEFGHKKYQPEEVIVKIKRDTKETDYLAECMKLKEQILQNKNKPEESIESLVEAFDKTHVSADGEEGESKTAETPQQNDVQKHLLATVGKLGGIRIWSKSGKLLASCALPKDKNMKMKLPVWPSLRWYKPDMLLIGDNKSQLLECNPLVADSNNKLVWKVVHHLHKRGIYGLTTSSPRVQTENDKDKTWSVWTMSQDRNVIEYCVEKREKLTVLATCGRFVYRIKSCPYDAGKIAVSVGDGAVRIWDTRTLDDDDMKLSAGKVNAFWQNIQGRVLTLAWHPEKENLLAYSTAESRVGILDGLARGARPLVPALSGGVYSLCWGLQARLYAAANGKLVCYNTNKTEQPPECVRVEFEGHNWEVSSVNWCSRGFLVGSNSGGVAVLTQELPHTIFAATFAFSKMIHHMDWHPQQTSESSEESPLKNMIAVCSLDSQNTIVILEYVEKDGIQQLITWKTLKGHKSTVFEVSWNPHKDGSLLSTSLDSTVRVWDVNASVCVSIFDGHMEQMSLCVSWSAFPQLADKVMSGGADMAVRVWDVKDFPADAYNEHKYEMLKRDKKKKDKKEINKEDVTTTETATLKAVNTTDQTKSSKRFLLPTLCKQIIGCNNEMVRKMFETHMKNSGKSAENVPDGIKCEDVDNDFVEVNIEKSEDCDVDLIKMFGTIQEVNEILDKELSRHLEAFSHEAWMVLSIFRGFVDATIQYASQHDLLCPYLLSLTPCVSFKYWKDATQLYLTQIDRLVAKGEDQKLNESKVYGGPVYRKTLTLLSVHDVKGAVTHLTENKLFKEAYVLCRIRYMDSIATQVLHKWANHAIQIGSLEVATICFIALGDLSTAATVLGKSKKQENLNLAAEIAKASGQITLADHMEKKAQDAPKPTAEETEEVLKELPTRIELLMKEKSLVNGSDNVETENGEE